MQKKIAIIGEYRDAFRPHTSLSQSLDYLQDKFAFEYEWVDTVSVEKKADSLLKNFAGIWSAPGSPFKSLEGALYAVAYARTKNVPHLGTCAGFQHAVIDIARHMLAIPDAQHEEYDAQSSTLFISRLACSLAGKTMEVFLKGGSLARKIYDSDRVQEVYYCNFSIDPAFKPALIHPQISISGVDQDREIRIIELPSHRFFVVTLFVPQVRSQPGAPHPLIRGFVRTVCTI